jgi:enoyl-CoA hydratase/carnithine racemase
MSNALLLDRDGPVATLTLNRPERRNALSLELMRELIATLGELSDDRELKVLVLAAEGPVFCSGHDLREMTGREGEFYDELFATCSELMLLLHRLPQPVVARVQGMATAAGCQLVAACDLAVASEEARFATPGVRIGLFCTTPMVEVARAVGRKRAMELLLTGEPIDAPTALAWGLVNRVVPAPELAEAALALARKVAEASSLTLGLGKRAFYENLEPGAAEAYEHASAVMAANALAADAREGIAAFLEKRPPHWSGR